MSHPDRRIFLIYRLTFNQSLLLTAFKFHVDQVQKKPDKFNEELLSDGTEENDTGFWNSLTRYNIGSNQTPLFLINEFRQFLEM